MLGNLPGGLVTIFPTVRIPPIRTLIGSDGFMVLTKGEVGILAPTTIVKVPPGPVKVTGGTFPIVIRVPVVALISKIAALQG